jgi:hypothetical protein
VDGLVELLIQVTRRITVKAERRVIAELEAEAQQVRRKAGLLFRVSEATLGQPDGVVREVIFPVAGEQTIEALVREAKALGTLQNCRGDCCSRLYGLGTNAGLNRLAVGRHGSTYKELLHTRLRVEGRESRSAQILLLDEMHNIPAGTFMKQRTVLNVLRYFSNELRISLVCFGVNEAREAISGDVQLARRFEE